MNIVLVGLGGFLGAVTRYVLDGWISQRAQTAFPVATFAINVSGCFLLGFFMTVVAERFAIDSGLRPLVAIGFIGAYTTFSTFGLETVRLIQDGSVGLAAANVLGSIVVGLAAVYLGVFAGRTV